MTGIIFLLDTAGLDAPQSWVLLLGRHKDHSSQTPQQLGWNSVIGFWPKEYKKSEGAKSRCSYETRCTTVPARSLSLWAHWKQIPQEALRHGEATDAEPQIPESSHRRPLNVFPMGSCHKWEINTYSIKLLPFGYRKSWGMITCSRILRISFRGEVHVNGTETCGSQTPWGQNHSESWLQYRLLGPL